MDLRELEAVVAVHEHGSFSGAATALFVSQPALTRRVALLERELDVKLFVRSSRGTYLTDAGRALIDPAQRALREADQIRKNLGMIRTGSHGTLVIAGDPNLSVGQIGYLVAEFHEAYPDVEVKIATCESTDAAITAVEAGIHDLAIVERPVRSGSLVSTPIWEDDYLAVFRRNDSRRSVDQSLPFVTAEMLRGRPMVRLPQSQYPQQQAKQLWEMVGMEPTSAIETESYELLVSIARGGRGVAVVPRQVAMQAYEDGAQVASPPRPITRSIALARRRDENSPIVGRFLRIATAEKRHLEIVI
jgi:DNA-binding transcriptional LysR family regulator